MILILKRNFFQDFFNTSLMSQKVKTENINSSFFDGHYKEIWKQVFPEKTTIAEADFIIAESALEKGHHILDLMCGNGRHSLELAKRGIRVTAVDNLRDYIDEISEKAAKDNLPVTCVQSDVMELQLSGEFDAVICMGNSLQFFSADDGISILTHVASHLKPGGKLFINTWSIAEIVFKNFKEKSWGRVNDMLFLTENRILFNPTRLETDSIIIMDSGEREEKKGVDYIFTLSELETILNKSGFILKEIYSIPGKKKFALGEPRAYIVAERK